MKKYISLLLVAAMLWLTAAVNADDHIENDDTQSIQMQNEAQDYNSSRSNKPRTISDDMDSDDDGLDDGIDDSRYEFRSKMRFRATSDDMDCDDSDDSCTPQMEHMRGLDRADKVKQAVEARKIIIKEKREDRLAQVKQRVESISVQKRAQFNGASKILENKVAAIDNPNWLKNTSKKIDRVMSDVQNISNEDTRALVEAVLIDLQTKIDDRLQEIYESSSDTTLEEVLEDVMWEDVMDDEDNNNEDEEDDDEDEDEEDDDENEDEDEDEENDEDEDEDDDK